MFFPLWNKPLNQQFIWEKSLTSLFFDFKYAGLDFNGSMYATKSIDFNSNKSFAQIKSKISDYESVIESLNKFTENE
jgi:hypothetical protein